MKCSLLERTFMRANRSREIMKLQLVTGTDRTNPFWRASKNQIPREQRSEAVQVPELLCKQH